uniref:Uncharacterized protein n=1 Tax=Neolamprologus brichardi TaxID=32507 RepID=A0A3Q4MQW6_NEOBR
TASKTDRQSPVKTFAGNWSTLDNNGMNGWDPRTLLLSEKDTADCLQFAENHMDKKNKQTLYCSVGNFSNLEMW